MDSLSGDLLSQAPTLFAGRPSEVIPLTMDDTALGRALAVLDSDSQVRWVSFGR